MQKQFLPIGLDFAKKDLRAAFLLSFLINTSDYYSQNDKDADGWFYCTADNLKERIGFTRADIQHAVTVLCAMNLLQTQKRGMPAKIYYRVNTDTAIYTNACLLENDKQVCTKTTNKFAENQQTSLHENDKQVCTNSANKFVEIQQTSLSENDSNKELINKELNNNNKNKELKEEESADFTNPLPPAPKKPVSKKSKVFDADAIILGTQQLIQKYYPNQSKGWGDLLNDYLINIKSQQSGCKSETFVKVCLEDADALLKYCSASNIMDAAIEKHIRAAKTGGKNKKGWISLTFSGYTDTIDRTQQDCLKELRNGVVSAEDFRFTDERYFNFFVANILTPFKKIGIVQAAMDTAKSQKAQFGVLVSHLSAEMLIFGSEIKHVANCLGREIVNHKATNPKQQKDFDFWLKNKGWEKFPAKAQKTAPTATQTPKAEPIQQTDPKAQISENKAPLPAPVPAVVSAPVSVVPIKEFLPQWLPGISYKFFVEDLVKKTSTKAGGFVYTMIAEGVFNSESFIAWLKANIEGYPEASDIIDNKMRETWNALESQIKKAKTA